MQQGIGPSFLSLFLLTLLSLAFPSFSAVPASLPWFSPLALVSATKLDGQSRVCDLFVFLSFLPPSGNL